MMARPVKKTKQLVDRIILDQRAWPGALLIYGTIAAAGGLFITPFWLGVSVTGTAVLVLAGLAVRFR